MTIEQRHYKALSAGVDQFGGNNDIEPVLAAYELGVMDHGAQVMQERFRISARRLLKNIFKLACSKIPI
ncbi:hypothetical protein [Enterococcus crotali]|uniref:hypothetical protein n=1 Tax=Enterococcus crotali TaxID=1453587 RepID=UPI000B0F90AA|nr:hypothetical protein [Enterococcus crotali]